MKPMKILCSSLMMLVALTTMTSVASATTLTSPKGTTYTTTIKGEAVGSLFITSAFGGLGTIECPKSKFEGQVVSHGAAATVRVKLNLLTFEGCNGGQWTSPVAVPGSLEIHNTSTKGIGTVTSVGAEIITDLTLYGTCVYRSALTGTDTGTLTDSSVTGGHATIDLSFVLSGNCGSESWEGKYTVTVPKTLEVD